MKYITTINQEDFIIEILDDHHVAVNGETCQMNFDMVSDQPVYSLLLNGKSYEAHIYEGDEGWEVLLQGTLYPATVIDEREHRLRSTFGGGPEQTGEFYLKAPMPGLVVDLPINDGQEVKEGQVLLILESMKMQNELKSPRDGVVSRIRVGVGDNVERRQTLLSVI
jgi:acetyl/propionyl-CoA carboxylase alpha subunit